MKSRHLLRSPCLITQWLFARIPVIFLAWLIVHGCALRPDSRSSAKNDIPDIHTAVAIYHGPRDEKNVALTFDACSSSKKNQFDERVIAILETTNTPATLFLGGKWMTDQADTVRMLGRNPQFELASHAYRHLHMIQTGPETMRQELAMSQEILFQLTGRKASLFRAPYGEINDTLVTVAAKQGMKTIQYDLASGDPDKHINADRLRKYVVSHTRPGSIIVMHMNKHGWHTAEALPEIIEQLRNKGYTFVTVSRLLESGAQPANFVQIDNDMQTVDLAD